MSVSNGKIVTPVSIDDIKSVLGENSNDLAILCKSDNINKWSKNKPIKHNCLFKPTEAQKKEVNYGISNIPYYRLLGKMTQDVINGSMQNATNISTLDTHIEPWHYQKPIGGYASPYRLGDFDGYFANASAPIGAITETEINSSLSGKVSVVFNKNTDTVSSLTFNDLASDKDFSNQYLGLCLSDGNKSFYMTQKVGFDEGDDVTISMLDSFGIFFRTAKLFPYFDNKTRLVLVAFVFISTTPIVADKNVTTNNNVFTPLYFTKCNIVISKKDINIELTTYAWWTFNGSIKNALNGIVNFTNTEDTTVFLKSINVDISDATGNILYSTAISTSSQGIASGERYTSGNKVLATSTIINKYYLASKAVNVKYTVTLAVGDYSKNIFSFAKISNELPKE